MNMIRLINGDSMLHVYFDINRLTQDFDNIKVRTESGEPVLTMRQHEIEKIKDLIAEEIIFTQAQYAGLIKSGSVVLA